MDSIDSMSPVFYFSTQDVIARRIAYAYIISEMRENYKLERGCNCVFDRRIINEKYEHIHLYFRKNELLAVYRSDPERGKYYGTSLPRYKEADIWTFKRNFEVENFAMDLKLGIYDVRFEVFFNLMFDFYITSGMEW